MSKSSNVPYRFSLRGIIRGLMLSENLGDVHDEVNHLCDLAGIPRPAGNFEEGWTDADWRNVSKPDINLSDELGGF